MTTKRKKTARTATRANRLRPVAPKVPVGSSDAGEITARPMLIDYARVSTCGRTLDSQLEQLREAGCSSRNIYREKVTGARPDRRELNRMLGKLGPGDVVTVTRIDRRAQDLRFLRHRQARIVDAKAQFRSLAEPWADSGASTGRLMLAVLGGLADVKRDLIRTRTAEGRACAEAQGEHIGPPPSLTPVQQKEATRRRAHGATLQELAHSYNVGITTIRRAKLWQTSYVGTPGARGGVGGGDKAKCVDRRPHSGS